jgi:hypothetical protein
MLLLLQLARGSAWHGYDFMGWYGGWEPEISQFSAGMRDVRYGMRGRSLEGGATYFPFLEGRED